MSVHFSGGAPKGQSSIQIGIYKVPPYDLEEYVPEVVPERDMYADT
jgi:hypothetical protein